MFISKKIRFALIASLSIGAIFVLTVFMDVQNSANEHSVQATSTATTTVTVLNTPPAWVVTAFELYPSATTTPTNSGTSTVWAAEATDSNGETYYLLICKASSTPVTAAGLPPVCGGGSTNQWAISTITPSGTQARVATTTQEAWAEKNDWYGYICDTNAGNPRCNAAQYNGLHLGATADASPFVVNHRPTFTLASDDSPTLPGATTTWTTTSDDPDTLGGDDTIKLFVCIAQDFDATIPNCGAGGLRASSTYSTANVTAQGYITPPVQDKAYPAYVYIIDDNKHPAIGATQASNTVLNVANAAPYVSSSTIAVYDVFGTTTVDTTLALTTEEGETDNFVVRFSVVDDNSCESDGGGQEVAGAEINVFRSGFGGQYGLGCDSSGEYNANYCYTHTNPLFTPTCYQIPGDCSGPAQSSVEWECTFSMWYIADPTDIGSVYDNEDWRGAVRASDEADTGPYSVDDELMPPAGTASEMTQFLSFRATGTPIAYGSLEPGQANNTHIATTTVYATGNTGLDQYLSGAAMCVTFPTCTGYATSTIYVPYQRYSLTSGSLYTTGTPLSTSTAPTLVAAIVIPKTTATSSPSNDDTYWGIEVPSTITYAGDYIGRNYIDAIVSPSGTW